MEILCIFKWEFAGSLFVLVVIAPRFHMGCLLVITRIQEIPIHPALYASVNDEASSSMQPFCFLVLAEWISLSLGAFSDFTGWRTVDIKFRFHFYDVNAVEVNFCLSFSLAYPSDKNKVNFRFLLKTVMKFIFLCMKL